MGIDPGEEGGGAQNQGSHCRSRKPIGLGAPERVGVAIMYTTDGHVSGTSGDLVIGHQNLLRSHFHTPVAREQPCPLSASAAVCCTGDWCPARSPVQRNIKFVINVFCRFEERTVTSTAQSTAPPQTGRGWERDQKASELRLQCAKHC